MTAEAKVPHEGSDWRAVDIFVFTNGQQHSPPRKYHLTAQELNWWNNVLRFLARSQYGSLNSTVDLYTVEGQKVDAPLELINGAAYVAVKPPENFIDTGYSKYLLKASRSWEKSQARRSFSIEIIKPEDGSALIAQSNLKIPVAGLKTNEEIINHPLPSDHTVIERPFACLNIHENPQKESSTVLKQLEKKRISPVQRSSILRKSTTSTGSPSKRDSLVSKDVITRNSKGPIRINEKNLRNNHNGNNKSKIPLKVAMPNAAKSESDQNENKDISSTWDNNNPNLLINGTELENKNENQDSPLEYHILKSVDSEIPSMIVPICGKHNSDDNHMNAKDVNDKLNNIAEECETHTSPNVGNIAKTVGLIENTSKAPTFDKEFTEQDVANMSQIQKAPNVSFRDNTDSKYVVISNGDMVNLKLQIEVTNGDTATSKKAKSEDEKCLSTDIPKTDKASQINVDSELAVQNKSLQSIYRSDYMGAHRNSALVIVKCPCCPENNFNMSTIGTENSTNHDRAYVILLPGLEKIPDRCQCHKIEESDKEGSSNRHSIFNPVKKTDSAMALEILNPALDISEITISSVRTTLPNIDRNAATPRNNEYVKIANESRHRVAIFDREVTGMKYADKDCSRNDCNEHNQCTTSQNIAEVLAERSGCLDKSTQTGVCSLLVEARIHEDGRYSFHLPPLEVLKYYKF